MTIMSAESEKKKSKKKSKHHRREHDDDFVEKEVAKAMKQVRLFAAYILIMFNPLPARTKSNQPLPPVQSDQALYCWQLNFLYFDIEIP
jgi:hypothetical protein